MDKSSAQEGLDNLQRATVFVTLFLEFREALLRSLRVSTSDLFER
jgi:hypothetical protein